MNTPLIKLLTMGHTLERATDRTGAYSLRYVNKFPKLRPVARVAGARPPPAGRGAPAAAQPSLFKAPKTPAAVEAESTPTGTEGSEGTKGTNLTGKTVQARPPAAPKVHIRWLATLSAFLAAGVAFVPKTAARIRDRLRSPSAELASARPGGTGPGESDGAEKRLKRQRLGDRGGAAQAGGLPRRPGRNAPAGPKSLDARGGALGRIEKSGGPGANAALKPMLSARVFSQISLDNGGPGGAPARAGGMLRGRDRRRRRARGGAAEGERANGPAVWLRPGWRGGAGGPRPAGEVRGTV